MKKKLSKKRKRVSDFESQTKVKKKKTSHDLSVQYENVKEKQILLELGKKLYCVPQSVVNSNSYEELPISGRKFLNELAFYLDNKKEWIINSAIGDRDWIVIKNENLKFRTTDFEETLSKCDDNEDELMIQVGVEFRDESKPSLDLVLFGEEDEDVEIYVL